MRAPLLAAVVLATACFSESDPAGGEAGSTDEGSTSASSTTTSAEATATSLDDSGSGGATACGDAGMCVELPGEGWMGPFVLAFVPAGDGPVACESPYNQPYGVPMHVGLEPGSIDCACDCVQPPTECVAEITKYQDDQLCMFASSFGQNNLPGDCTPTSGVDSVDYEAAPALLPTCAAAMQGETIKGVSSWEQDVLLCGLADAPPPCDGGACIPAVPPTFGAVCIVQAGAHECPGDFADEHLVFVDAEDQRECDGCTCDPVAADCTPVVFRATDMGCNDLDDGQTGCVDTAAALVVATTWQPSAPAACDAVQSVSGEVVGVGPHTLCCRS